MLSIKSFVSGPLDNNLYVLVSEDSKACALVDPGIDISPVIRFVEDNSLEVKLILLTHGHFDHAFNLGECKLRYEAPVAYHTADQFLYDNIVETSNNWGMPGAHPAPAADIELAHGLVLELAGVQIEVRHTPGHSPGQVAFVFGDHAVVGDTLFRRGIGRWDLPEGDYDLLEQSIKTQLYTLPDETTIWPGHGLKTMISEEKRFNPYVGNGSRFIPKP